MVKMIFVEQQTLPFQFLKDINWNLENVNVVESLVFVQLDYVPVNMDGMDLVLTTILLEKDVNWNMENVNKL